MSLRAFAFSRFALGLVAFAATLLTWPGFEASATEHVLDESYLAEIRLAARGGDFELALKRLGRIDKPVLIAKGNAALGIEYALAGNDEEADKYFELAREVATSGDLRQLERADAFIYLAGILNTSPRHKEEAKEALAAANGYVGRLAGIDLSLGIAQLAAVSYEIYQDRQQLYDILQLMPDAVLRDKLVEQYGLQDLAGG